MTEIFTGFFFGTLTACAAMVGMALALTVAAGCVGIVLLALGAVFDRVTVAMARRWKKKGVKPRSKIGRIILAHGDGI